MTAVTDRLKMTPTLSTKVQTSLIVYVLAEREAALR